MTTTIANERPDTDDARALIAELDAHLIPQYPIESHHGYSVEKLLLENVAFFVLRQDGRAVGCGGILLVGSDYGEIKRMFVRPAFRGKGLSKLMLEHLAAYALERGVNLLRLETGIHQREAIGLYERMGFVQIPPFGPYPNDRLSRCYEKRI